MKSFLNFFSEARQTKASTKARQLGLKGDGQGNWVDKAGNIVARTEAGELKFTSRKGGAEREEPGKTPQYKTPERETPKKVAQPVVPASVLGLPLTLTLLSILTSLYSRR